MSPVVKSPRAPETVISPLAPALKRTDSLSALSNVELKVMSSFDCPPLVNTISSPALELVNVTARANEIEDALVMLSPMMLDPVPF